MPILKVKCIHCVNEWIYSDYFWNYKEAIIPNSCNMPQREYDDRGK